MPNQLPKTTNVIPIANKKLKKKKNRILVLNNKKEVYLYIKRKSIYKRKYYKRPIQLKYLMIAKACGISYKQARLCVNKLIQENLLTKWSKYPTPCDTQNFYRLKEFEEKT